VELHTLIGAPHSKLLDELSRTVEELCAVIDELAFTKSEELRTAALAWTGEPGDSVQKKDRAAKYRSATTTMELYHLEGKRDALIERKFFIIRLLDQES